MDLSEMWSEVVGLDSSGLGYGPVANSCEHDNVTSVSVKGGEFLE
jgi:hypothetical protein